MKHFPASPCDEITLRPAPMLPVQRNEHDIVKAAASKAQ
jgi:hypothetical protein